MLITLRSISAGPAEQEQPHALGLYSAPVESVTCTERVQEANLL